MIPHAGTKPQFGSYTAPFKISLLTKKNPSFGMLFSLESRDNSNSFVCKLSCSNRYSNVCNLGGLRYQLNRFLAKLFFNFGKASKLNIH